MASAAITIENNHGSTSLAQYRTVFVTIDHASMVSARRSREDGKDLWVEWGGASPARRLPAHVSRPNTATARVYFALQASLVAAGTDTDYTLRWGNLDESGGPIRMDFLSQYRPWLGTYQSTRRQPFLFYDDFRYGWSSGFSAYSTGNAPDTDIYDNLGGGWAIQVDDTTDPHVRVGYPGDKRLFVVEAGAVTWPSAYRVRCRYYADAGATDPSSGLVAFSTDNASDIRGYTGGIEAAYTNIGLVGHTAGGEVPLDVTAGGNLGAQHIDLQLDIEDTGSASNTTIWVRDAASTTFVAVATFSDVTRTFTSGEPGMFLAGTSLLETYVYFRDFAVELWDGVADADWDATVTIPSAVTFPTVFELGTDEQRLYPVASSAELTSQRVTIYEQELGSVKLRWKTMGPEAFYQLIAFHDQSKCSATFTATLPDLASATYRIQQGSLQTQKQSATEYSASVTLRKVAV